MPKKKSAAIPARPVTSKRALKTPAYQSFRLSKRLRHPAGKLPSAWQILRDTVKVVRERKFLFGAIASVFAVLYVVLVRGFASSDLTVVKDIIDNNEGGSGFQASTGFGLFVYLLGNSATPKTEVASLYQFILLVVVSLALIWAFRQVLADKPLRPTMREAYYKGNAPFVPYMLILGVMALQLLPVLIGTSLYQQVVIAGLAVGSAESLAWLIVLIFSIILTVYMLCSSLFALYVVTLPDITPMQALRTARELVRHRRLEVLRKIAFLPFVLLLVGSIIFLPIIMYATAAAEILIFVYGLLCLVLAHGYMYQLYRKLL